jgi:phage tail-like protein
MAVARDLPYLGCHFQVRWSPGDGPPAGSGFSEVMLPPFPAVAPAGGDGDATSGSPAMGAVAPGAAIGATSAATVAEGGGSGGSAAAGASSGSLTATGASSGRLAAARSPGPANPALVVLRRGFLGSLDLYKWWNDTRLGLDKRERTLTVDLLDGERGRVVCTWEFAGAWPVQLDYSPLQALGASVLVETLTLRYATMTMK